MTLSREDNDLRKTIELLRDHLTSNLNMMEDGIVEIDDFKSNIRYALLSVRNRHDCLSDDKL